MAKHTLYCGVTESGKTTMARHVARHIAKKEKNSVIFVYDPVRTATHGGDWPEKALIFDDMDSLLDCFDDYLANNDGLIYHFFIDESGEVFTVGDKTYHWIATRGRHYGINLHMIAQRPKMIAPNVRSQAAIGYMFRMAKSDAQELFADFGHDLPADFSLDCGDFVVLYSGHAEMKRGNVFKLSTTEKE